MADGFSLTIPGLDDMLRELKALPAAIQAKVMTTAVGAGAAVLRNEVVRRAPESTGPLSDGHPPAGTLKKAIYSMRVKEECTQSVEVWKVGVRKGKAARNTRRRGGSVNLDAYYAAWVEFGHFARVPHAMTKTARAASRAAGAAKWVPAHPFFRPGIAASTDAAFAAMQASFSKNLPLATAAMRYLKVK